MTFVCPCGRKYEMREVKPHPLESMLGARRSRSASKRYNMAVWVRNDKDEFERVEDPYNERAPAEDLVEYKAPARSPSVESDVKVPLSQAAITGGLWGLALSAGWAVIGLEKPLAFWGGSSLLITCFAWSNGVSNMRKLMWRIEKFTDWDIDRDKHKGEPPPSPQPRSRTVIERQGAAPRLPESWEQLDAEQQVIDVHRFAEIVWGRQEAKLGTGQKALRGTALPSGFSINDDIHGWMLTDLDDAGVIRRNGSAWRLEARPQVVKKLIRVEQW